MCRNRIAMGSLRTTLALVFAAFGTAKFFPYEADAVAPLMAFHPLLAWLPDVLGPASAARFLGVFELATALLLLASLRWTVAGILGGAMATWTFVVTSSLLLFVPGVFEASAGGFPAVSGFGQFLLKDVVLLAASAAVLADAVAAWRGQHATRRGAAPGVLARPASA